MHSSTVSLFAVFLALSGCASSDDLAGTWSNNTCYGYASMPDDIESCSLAITFTDGLEISLQSDMVSLPATADYPGCNTVLLTTGQTWSTRVEGDHEVFTVSGGGSATAARTGCVNEEDNMDAASTDEISIAEGDVDYELSGNELTVLTSDLEGTYQK